MADYYHSVTLDAEKCKGCTNCIKRCPTEAIRVRDGRAWIFEERCIDCGECIRVCPNHAKLAVTDSLDLVKAYPKSVIIPAPAFMGQFPTPDPGVVLSALRLIGFDEVYEVALAADAVSMAMRRYLKEHSSPRPLISSACPAVVRLIQVRFPALLDHLIKLESPMEMAAKIAKDTLGPEHGVFFVSPCPAKVTAIKQPVGRDKSAVDGAFSMSAIYAECLRQMEHAARAPLIPKASGYGMGWGRSGGETTIMGRDSLAVDGIHQCIKVFEEVERDKLAGLDFIEAQACVTGCVGGCLAVENPFVARVRVRNLAAERGAHGEEATPGLEQRLKSDYFTYLSEVKARPVLRLDDDISRAIDKLRQLEAVEDQLPGLDCGACGAPSCRALAEDIVRGYADEMDCVLKLRERVHGMAEEIVDLARHLPRSMGMKSHTQQSEDDDGEAG